MLLPHTIQNIIIEGQNILLATPCQQVLEQQYLQQKENHPNYAFPYWAKLWPSALAICQYLHQHRALVKDKRIMEWGAGLGLPSLFAAGFAKNVLCTDMDEAAVAMAAHSANINKLKNIACNPYNWLSNELPQNFDVLLLSDINYNPADFEPLLCALKQVLAHGGQIILSTPQRLMAKPFIETLLAYCVQKTTIPITYNNESTEIFIMHLQTRG